MSKTRIAIFHFIEFVAKWSPSVLIFATAPENLFSTFEQCSDHITATSLETLRKSVVFHQSFGRTHEKYVLFVEKYKTRVFDFAMLSFFSSRRRCFFFFLFFFFHAFHAYTHSQGKQAPGARIIFSTRALRKIEFTQVGIHASTHDHSSIFSNVFQSSSSNCVRCSSEKRSCAYFIAMGIGWKSYLSILSRT